MSQKTQVVAAIIEKGGKFLLGKRALHKKSAPGYWCPPTGRVESGETMEAAVERETLEEVGLRVKAGKKLFEFDTDDRASTIHWFQVTIVSGEARLANDEHSQIRWVSYEEMLALTPMFPEDLEVFRSLS